MKTIAELKAEQAKELEKLTAELSYAEQAPVAPDRVMSVHTGELAWFIYKVKGIKGALDILCKFDKVIPYSKAKDGCLYVKPFELMKESQQDVAEGSYVVALDVDQGAGFGPDVKLVFWVRLESGVFRVQCDIEGPDYIGKYSSLGAGHRDTYGRNGRLVSREFTPNVLANAYCDSFTKWGSGEFGAIKKSAHFSYRLASDYDEDTPGHDLSHALGQLENLANELGES